MQSSSVKKLDALTSLRFFAAAGVVLLHAGALFQLPISDSRPLAWNNGVCFFFVLSGFILTYVYGSQEKLDKGRFLMARVARIWPAHLAALVIFLLVVSHSYWSRFDLETWLANISLTHAWFLQPRFESSFVGPSWSVSVELAFYLCFIFLVRDWSRTWGWKLAGAALLLLIVGAAANWMDFRSPPESGHALLGSLMYFSPYGRLFEFVLGMSTAALWQRFSPRIRLGTALATLAEVAALILVLFILAHAKEWSEAVGSRWPLGNAGAVWLSSEGFSCGAFALLIFVMALGQGLLARLLSLPFLVLLGEISYSVYLLHIIPQTWMAEHVNTLAIRPGWGGFSLYFLIILSAAYLTWALVERPCRYYLVTWWVRRAGVSATDSPSSINNPGGMPAKGRRRDHVFPSKRGVALATALLTLALLSNYWTQEHATQQRAVAMISEEKPPPVATYAGTFDRADREYLAGWAWTPQRPGEAVTVEIYDGDALLLKVQASEVREDLIRHLGHGAHGFVCPTPEVLKDGRPHQLHARIAGSTFALEHSPRKLHCEPVAAQ